MSACPRAASEMAAGSPAQLRTVPSAFRDRLDFRKEKKGCVFYPARVECHGDDAPAVLRAAMLVSA